MNRNRQGVVLIVVMSFLTVILFLAGTVATILTVNLRQTGYAVAAVKALQQAEAGADIVFSRVRADERSGILPLTARVETVSYAAPSGYTFDPVTNLTRLANRRLYTYRVIGRSGTARAIVDVVVGRAPAFMVGAFGNQQLSMGPTTTIGSYASSEGTEPTTSTGDASVGANTTLGGSSSAIRGTIYLGETTAGVPASYPHETATHSAVVRMARIDPDPLGAADGPLAADFSYHAVSNDNASAVGGTISGGQLRISGDVTLPSGSYYVSEISIANHRTLTINASAGPVRIYLTGGASTQPGATISVNPPIPNNLQIYSNSTDPIAFQPNNTFVGFLYAPFASISMQPNASFFGAVWGNSLSIQPNGVFYVDTDFLDQFDRDAPLRRWSWKHAFDG